MCRATRCKTCGKTTWTGCGKHIENVKAKVPDDQWCPGHPEAERKPGLLTRLFRRT